MTDRAATMKCFDVKLLEFLQTQLGQETTIHFLHCNAHFLLGLSRSCDISLKAMEEEEGRRLGRDALPKFAKFSKTETATSRVLRLTCDIVGPRDDDKNGCRAEWLAYCEEHGLKSYMTSYRSNRFNCYFLSAAAIIYHLDHLKSFLTEYLSNSNNKIDSVIADLQDDTILQFVCALALIYIHITGPFWELLQSHVTYMDLHKYVQQMYQAFEYFREDASDLLMPDFKGVFDGALELHTDLNPAVLKFASEHNVKSAIEFIMRDFVVVTRMQLNDFLAGGKYDAGVQPPEVEATLKHCHLTNLLGENVFGELDFDLNRRRHASYHHRTSNQIFRFNRTSKWLGKKKAEDTSKLMAAARRKAKSLQQQHRRQEQIVRLKIREKLLETKRRKKEKEAKQAEVKSRLIHKVLFVGGPCRQKSDVVRLIRHQRKLGFGTTKLKEILKNQIRFQKSILKRKSKTLLLKGNLLELQQALESHLSNEIPQDTVTEHTVAVAEHTVAEHSAAELYLPEMEEASVVSDISKDIDDSSFQFSGQGQWVAVFYDNQYYIGQVLDVKNSGKEAVVKFLENTGRKDLFRWPKKEDIDFDVSSHFVFRWDFECLPVTNDFRIWRVDDVDDISEAYMQLLKK